jgi:carboxypeptidase family protein/TonB-dependent receptor-like protein
MFKTIPWLMSSLLCLTLLAVASAQSDRGTITGTINDPNGALIPNATVIATSTGSQTEYRSQSTGTGNYTLASIPAGTYSLRIEAAGFRVHVRSGITVQVAQTARIDVTMEVGNASDTVTITADASLLRTESVEQSTVLNGDKVNQLPLNFANNGVRNPLSFLQLAPGTSITGWNTVRVNGSPNGTFRVIFEGQDTTSALDPRLFNELQPTLDAIEEFTVQANNFSAEFGQVGGGLLNFTARSGTNRFTGSIYDYLNNEALNAAPTFAPIDAQGNKAKTKIRQHDFGGTFGGPVWLPHIYNGRDKTFFFFSTEVYHQKENRFDSIGTIPTTAFRNGDFSQLLTGKLLETSPGVPVLDPLGRTIPEGTIYDPRTARTVNGQVVLDPFPGNKIPIDRFDPLAAKVQSLIPGVDPKYANLLNNNFERRFNYRRIEQIYSWKVDHNLTSRAKLSVYVGMQRTHKDNGQDGLPDPISKRRDQPITSKTLRINYDHTLSPTLLNHFGVGYQRYYNPDTTPITEYDSASELGLPGAVVNGFPRFLMLGSMDDLGPTNYQLYTQDKPTFYENMTWVHGDHSTKFGGEFRIDSFNNLANNGATGTYNFSPNQTALPNPQLASVNGRSVGSNYASFLLGLVNTASINNPTAVGFRRSTWAGFIQDDWKFQPRLTLNLGMRYDYQNPLHELHDRLSMFDPTIANPAAGGLKGATRFIGDGEGRCNCGFAKTYPWGFAPRLGAAWSINDKTVVRVGWGITYGQLSGFSYIGAGQSLGFGFNSINFSNPLFGAPGIQLNQGLNYNSADLYRLILNPGIRPSTGQIDNPPALLDPNAGRPPRLSNWVINLQHEFGKNMMVEVAYVGNRGAWFEANGLVNLNAIRPEDLQARGLDITKAEDRTLLTSRLDSNLAKARGFSAPYAGFPLSATVAQSLRPFPQFGNLGLDLAPLGNTWYDSLQVKATKRLSRGMDFTLAYTFSKTLTTVTEQGGGTIRVNDVFNRAAIKALSPNDQPHVLVANFRYEVPVFGLAQRSGLARALFTGWNLSGIFRYASGEPIPVPNAQNNLDQLLFRRTFANRVPGQPLFTKNPNCGCVDPRKDLILNPLAWSDPAPGTFGVSAPFYSDYRFARVYDESMSFGKVTKFRERMSLEFRVEFFNIFNRVRYSLPVSVTTNPLNNDNALATPRRDAAGNLISGFGRIDIGNTASAPRSGQIALRLRF